MGEYERAYGRLNQRQREAVDTIDGPVLVIAGPGTGKTELLSARVANILEKTDSKPQNVLCLTFTNKAAINMKARIIKQTKGRGAKVNASTFHSFAAEIMNLYPDSFWNAARLSAAPDAVQLDAIESTVRKLPLDNPLALKFAGQFTLLPAVKRSISLSKKAGLTPDKLRSILAFNLVYIDGIEEKLIGILDQRLSAKNLESLKNKIEGLAEQKIDELVTPLTSLSTVLSESLSDAVARDEDTGKSQNTSRWKARWVQTIDGKKGMFKERERNLWWLELADVYEKYREILHGRGFYDYDDMIVEVIAQLEQNPAMLADVQERFNYVLIDEFQDTTPAQLRLAHLVADHFSAEGRPNLMAVGDDDQSIYKFNGAELNNMLGFRRSYPSGKTIILTENYRSTQEVMDTAKRIIEQAETRLVNTDKKLAKGLVARAEVKKGAVKAVSYSSRELQMSMVARDIKQNYKSDTKIGVLARSHDSLIRMAAILQRLKVPVRYEQSANILDHELINQVYLLMKLIAAIQDGDDAQANALIHRILRWQAWGIEPEELWRLAVSAQSKSWLGTLLSSRSGELKAIGRWFLRLAKYSDSQPLAVTIEQTVGLRDSDDYTSPLRKYLVGKSKVGANDYFHGLSAIQLLRALVQEFAAGSQPTVAEFARFIEINKENEVIVPDESPFITGSKAVQLLTVHKAKGLEFDAVYVIDAIDSDWLPSAGGRKTPSNLPLLPPLDELDDYVRLMYVAVTRAKSSLTISAYHQDHAGKEVAISSIVQAAIQIEPVDEDDKQALVAVLEENLHWPRLSGGREKEMLKARLEEYNLYATHLLDFLDVSKGGPRYFKERHLIYLPEAKSSSLAYGSAMHAALEQAQKQVNRGAFKLAEVKNRFDRALRDEQRSPVDYERYLKQGEATLTRLFSDFKYKLPKGSLSEQIIKDVNFAQARIGGTLDRVDRSGDFTTIVDYKTGSPLNSFDTRNKAKAIRAYKHKMQLIFYTLLLNLHSDAQAGKIIAKMVYVEAGDQKNLERSYVPSEEDIDRIGRLIIAVWKKIMKLELPDTSSYPPDIEGIRAFENDLLNGAV